MSHDPRRIDVDDYWLSEWASEGLTRLGRLLERHAAFERYLAEREGADRPSARGRDEGATGE